MAAAKRESQSPEQQNGSEVKKAKREIDLNQIQPTVRLRSAKAENGEGDPDPELTLQFRHTPVAPVRVLKDQEALMQLLTKETAEALGCMEAWVRQVEAGWIQQMVDELPSARRQMLRQQWHRLQGVTSKDFFERWGQTSDFASLAIELWLEDKSLEEVLQRCKDLGQLSEKEMSPGYILQGSFVDAMALSEDLSFDQLLPMIRRLAGEEVSMYTISHHNCFESEPRVTMTVSQLEPKERQGSLNTTWDYKRKSSRSGVELLDSYHDSVSKFLKPCADVELNKLMYLIWKLPHYVTSYHQDTHVPPHFTLYNQVSGVSIFHFLPVLLGLFVTHVGRHQGPVALKKVLEKLDGQKIGSLVVLGPGQVAFISPMGSHGVWVPSVQQNPSLPAFQLSVIRAAEVFLKPVMEKLKKRLKQDDWKNIMKENREDLEKFDIYREVQWNLRERLKLTREDWLWMTRRYLREAPSSSWRDKAEDDASSSSSS